MCRYGYKIYKPSFVCFACRKSFKKVAFEDWLSQRPADNKALANLSPHRPGRRSSAQRDADARNYQAARSQLYDRYREQVGVCPDCGERSQSLGLDFKAPKRSDVEAWKAVEGAQRIGHHFGSCGCDGYGWIPASNAEYRRYLQSKLAEYRNRQQRALVNYAGAERAERSAYWADRVVLVQLELDAI